MNGVIEYQENSKIKSKLNNKKFSMQFLPVCLIEESRKKKIIFLEKNLKPTYLIDITHNLLLKYYFKKENQFNLSSLVLKEKYGHLYNYYINYLIEKKILILIKKHLKGRNARVYKLNDNVINGEITRFKNSDTTLLKKYKNAVCSVENNKLLHNIIEPEIKSKLIEDLFSVEIDYAKSIFFLDSSLQEYDIYQKNKYSVESIKDKHIFYHFDSFGRLHTNFTILKSFIRKNCLLIEDEETFEIDIKNSQPLFLNLVMKDFSDDIDPTELEFYRYLTFEGNFYQFLKEKFQIKDKKIVKEITYKVLFGRNYPNKYDKMFSQLFPSIYAFIKKFKKQKGDYRTLSYELQKYESNFLFNKVVKSLNQHYPDVKLISCHDSLICKQSDKTIVSDTLGELLKEEFNFISSHTFNFNI